jgi:hypothetical protein
MKTISLTLIILFIGSLTGAAQKSALPSQSAAVSSPAAVVRELYRVNRSGDGHVFEKRGRKYQERFFDKKLAGLIWKDLMETPKGEVGHIDFDPLYGAQDMKISNFRIGAPVMTGDRATVPVSFNNYEQKVTINFRLLNTKEGWKIENIDYGGGSDFVKILSEPL